ncbi:hypothetical protein KSP40_PGU013136 [Platanthera guangdongensis]|uniref:Uncharacterized protein n=1 Tax=Platanthera guangdongensis TaxID=2320717 RepID=A0ABR2MDB3_9ASPA
MTAASDNSFLHSPCNPVTWEHLVDAFLPPEINEVQGVAIEEKISDCSIISERADDGLLKDLLRRIKVPLDLIYIKGGKLSKISSSPVVQTIVKSSVGYMDMVSPMIYTVFLHLAVLVQSTSHLSEAEYMPLAIQHVKFLLFALSPSVNFHAAVCFLYVHLNKPFDGKIGSLVLWRIIAKGMTEKIDMVFDLSVLRIDGVDVTYSVLYWFLCYPLILLCSKIIYSDCSGSCLVSPQRDLLSKALVEVLNAFFDYQKCGKNACTQYTEYDFLNCLCELLIKVLDESNTCQHKLIISSSWNSQSIDAFLFFSEMLICILVHTLFYIEDLRVSLEGREKHCGLINNIFALFERWT